MGLVIMNKTTQVDDEVYNIIFQIRNDFWDVFFRNITRFANIIPAFCITTILLLTLSKKDRYILGTTILITLLTNQGLKYSIKRLRPEHLRLIKQGGYSFPSGHAMVSIAIYGFLIYLVNQKIKKKSLKILLTILLVIGILSIGISRIYVGVHYPSDVVAGYLLALSILLLVIDGYKKVGD